jgi:uncharacterized protein (DUF3084 family)
MKYKTVFSTLALSAASLFIGELYAQNLPPLTKAEDQAQAQKSQEAEKMTAVKNEQAETKAKAREAQRVGEEADDAAKQSKDAVKAEKKAQKSRKKADKQAQKAKAARDKSNLN